VGVRALAKNSRHGTADRTESNQSHFAILRTIVLRAASVLRTNVWCAEDGTVLGGIEFGGTWHSISRASDYGVVEEQPRAGLTGKPFYRSVLLSPKRASPLT
jgi:hypothetical protein